MDDTISRAAAIDALESGKDKRAKGNIGGFYNAIIQNDIDKLRNLPSAEKPFKLPEIYVAEGFDTVEDEDGNIGFGVYVPDENQIFVAGDVEDEIQARALLHEVCHWVQDMCGRPFDEEEANEFSDIVYGALLSAKPEILACGEDELNVPDTNVGDMRLIDADALEREGWSLCRTFQEDKNTMVYETKKPSDFPTIEERKPGKWIPIDIPWYRCSECGAVREHKSFMENFCPNCGAKMEVEHEG